MFFNMRLENGISFPNTVEFVWLMNAILWIITRQNCELEYNNS